MVQEISAWSGHSYQLSRQNVRDARTWVVKSEEFGLRQLLLSLRVSMLQAADMCLPSAILGIPVENPRR